VLRLRIALVGVLVFCGVVAALVSVLCALSADVVEYPPARITREDVDTLATGGAGFIVSLVAPTWVWWHLLPRARRAGVLTMAAITWLMLGGVSALTIAVHDDEGARPYEGVWVDLSPEERPWIPSFDLRPSFRR
jgi:hypothetical protein